MSEPFLGEIRMAGFNFAPDDWALCNGQLLSVTQNTALYNLLGTTYGGDGVSTFALPDLRSRVPVHQGTGTGLSAYVMGQLNGVESVALTSNQMPQHNHTVGCSTAGGNAASPAGSVPAVESTGTSLNYNSAASSTMNAGMIGEAGGSAAHTNIQPCLCVNFIIALAGIYPEQS